MAAPRGRTNLLRSGQVVLSPPVPFSRPSIDEATVSAVVEVLRSGWITTGPRTAEFERAFAEYTGTRHALAVTSGTAGLHLLMLALELGPGDEVLVPSMTWPTTANVVEQVGARPIFVEVERATRNLDIARIEEAVSERTRAVIPVHFAGAPCDMDPLRDLAGRRGLHVLEDAAHAAGTSYKGRRAGGLGTAAVFSFHPIKNMTTGEGGMITTDDDDLAARLKLYRFHGVEKDAWKRYGGQGPAGYDVALPGLKYNLTDIQSALGLGQLARLAEFNARRTELATRYLDGLRDVPGLELPGTPAYEHEHPWHLFTVLVDPACPGRDAFMAALQERGVGTGLHFTAVHRSSYYSGKYGLDAGTLPVTEDVADRICSLPLFPAMSNDDADYVVEQVLAVMRGAW